MLKIITVVSHKKLSYYTHLDNTGFDCNISCRSQTNGLTKLKKKMIFYM